MPPRPRKPLCHDRKGNRRRRTPQWSFRHWESFARCPSANLSLNLSCHGTCGRTESIPETVCSVYVSWTQRLSLGTFRQRNRTVLKLRAAWPFPTLVIALRYNLPVVCWASDGPKVTDGENARRMSCFHPEAWCLCPPIANPFSLGRKHAPCPKRHRHQLSSNSDFPLLDYIIILILNKLNLEIFS